MSEKEIIKELFVSVFSEEPWYEDFSDTKQLDLLMSDYIGQNNSLSYGRVTRIIRTSPRTLIFGAFGLVVLARLIHCVVLRTQNHLKIKALGSEIFWLTNIRQQQENADDSILIHSRRLTN
jgi:hypothetical protein